jgi:hypothetical protein
MDSAAYLDRLVRALVVTESAALGEGQVVDHGHVATVLQNRIYPMVLEWSAVPFLPPAELVVLFDRFAKAPHEWSPADGSDLQLFEDFGLTLQDGDGIALAITVAKEIEGLPSETVRQAVRARALAIACPVARLSGSYTGSIPELRQRLRDAAVVRESYHRHFRQIEKLGGPAALLEGIDLAWLAQQSRTWNTKSVRDFLSGRLRPRDEGREEVQVKVDDAAKALVRALQAVVEARLPKLETFDALCETVRARPSGDLAEAILRRVLPVVSLQERSWSSQELPVGGYADLSTRGTYDRLLISNLAYPEEEFVRRVVENELLFYELEAPPAQQPPKQFVFLDAGPATWGIPRLAGAAVALSVAGRARERGAEARIAAAGRVDRPFEDIDRARGVHELLDYQRWGPDLAAELGRWAEAARRESKGHATGADLFVCSEAGKLAEIGEWARAADLPPGLRLHVFTTDLEDGQAALWRREAGAFVPLARLSLAAKDLLPEKPSPAAPPALRANYLSTIEVNWDWASNALCAAIDDRGRAVTGHENGELHLWDAVRGAHLGLLCTFSQGIASVALSGDYLLVVVREPVGGPRVPALYSLRIDGKESGALSSRVARLEPNAVAAGWLPGQFFWWESETHLVEYRADRNVLERRDGCLKRAHQPFFVSAARQELVWREPGGKVVHFNLRERRYDPISDSTRALLEAARHRAVDPAGTVLVRMQNQDRDAEVRYAFPPPSNLMGVGTLRNCQPPRAVNGRADRLISANSDSLWFWGLRDGKLVRQIASPRQKLSRIHAEPAAIFLEFKDREGILLRYGPEGVQVERPRGAGPGHLRSGVDVAKERTRFGGLELAWPSGRRLEFYRRGEKEPFIRFWFQAPHLKWVMASRDAVAGNAIGDLSLPEGVQLSKDPVRLARLLREAVHGHA